MARPFPTFGRDMNGRQCLFIGENHADNVDLLQLAWQLMYHHNRVQAVFIEYYKMKDGPTGPGAAKIKADLVREGFQSHREHTMHTEVAQLKYQCDRYGILLEGWNVEKKAFGAKKFGNAMKVMSGMTAGFNSQVTLKLMLRLKELPAVRSYIIFGGREHGPALRGLADYFPDLPCYTMRGGVFHEYLEAERLKGEQPTWAP